METPRLLAIDDDPAILRSLDIVLSREGIDVLTTQSTREGLELVRDFDPAVVLTDLRMPVMDGLEFLTRARQIRERLVVVVVTAYGSIQGAVEAVRAGAYDYLTKPFDPETLRIVVHRAIEHRQLTERVRRIDEESRQQHRFGRLIGKAAGMRNVYDLVDRIAPTRSTVLLLGESGTGKELIAREIHDRSDRADGPFVPVSCAAIPGDLLETELFGHVKGAFTDAVAERRGLFEQADGGTLVLDEIAEMPVLLQSKLLRVLQDQEIRPVGGGAVRKVDVRLIASTHQDLQQAIKEGRFREDLYYRLNVIAIELPPLRERREDIPLLAHYFLERYNREYNRSIREISAAAMRTLFSYDWPGNVRELENFIERAVLLSDADVILADDLPEGGRDDGTLAPDSPQDVDDLEHVETLAELAERHIRRVLRLTGNDKDRTAKLIGIGRATLYRKLSKMHREQ